MKSQSKNSFDQQIWKKQLNLVSVKIIMIHINSK